MPFHGLCSIHTFHEFSRRTAKMNKITNAIIYTLSMYGIRRMSTQHAPIAPFEVSSVCGIFKNFYCGLNCVWWRLSLVQDSFLHTLCKLQRCIKETVALCLCQDVHAGFEQNCKLISSDLQQIYSYQFSTHSSHLNNSCYLLILSLLDMFKPFSQRA